jgi:hypothetical protein
MKKPSTQGCNNGLVGQYIGSAFDTVKLVADNLDKIISSGGTAIISETAPSTINLVQGSRWYKPSEATSYIWFCDGDSCQWVQEPVGSGSSNGSTGSDTLVGLSDVLVSNPLNDEVISYDASSGKWKNKPCFTVGDLPQYESFSEMVTANPTTNVALLKSYYADQNKGSGLFYKTTETGTPNTNNGGTWFVDSVGAKWKRLHNGTVSIHDFGFVADFVLTSDSGATSTGDGTDNSNKLQSIFNDVEINELLGDTGKYWFGVVGVNQKKTVCPRPIRIDWRNAELFCAHVDPTLPSITSTLIEFLNTDRVYHANFEFTQINFNALLAGGAGGRGVHPYVFAQTTGSGVFNRGVQVGNITVHKGQSIFTAGSNDAGSSRLEGVEFFGKLKGVSVYYGVSCFHSGYGLKGSIELQEYVRAWILTNVKDVDLHVAQTTSAAIATSSSGLIDSKGVGFTQCKNIHVKASFDQINGPVSLVTPIADGSVATISDCVLDIFVNDFGSNLNKINSSVVITGSYDTAGAFLGTGTGTFTDNEIKIRVGAPLDTVNNLYLSQTRTPNNLRNLIDAQRFDVSSFQNELIPFRTVRGAALGHRGNLSTKPLTLSMKTLLGKVIGPDPFQVHIDCYLSLAGEPLNFRMQRWVLIGAINSDGTETLYTSTKVYEAGTGVYNPAVTFTTSPTGSPNVTITASSGSNENGRLVLDIVSVSPSVVLV